MVNDPSSVEERAKQVFLPRHWTPAGWQQQVLANTDEMDFIDRRDNEHVSYSYVPFLSSTLVITF